MIKFISYHKSDEKVGYLGVGKPQGKKKATNKKSNCSMRFPFFFFTYTTATAASPSSSF